ncbi:OmpW family outer membrane protein [Escherichia coli]
MELLAATPFRHKIGTRATGDIATVHHLPPTLMAQWYFGDASSNLSLCWAGINATPPSLIMDLTIMAKRRGFPISV